MQNEGGVSVHCSELSLLTPIGYQSGDCGYCKQENSSASYYARSKSLCPVHYQMLMDRGWRRSGSLLYLPDAARSCCPHYTIRLPSSHFKPNKDQRQAINRWNRYVLGERYIGAVAKQYPKSKAEKKQEMSVFDLVATVHGSEASQLKDVDVKPEHNFTVILEPDTFTEEKFALFDNYQRHVHHEGDSDISRAGFKRFLCSSPLHRHSGSTDPTKPKQLGSYHQCYRLDGRLIAMGVLDLLPHAVSGVYFLYHSDFEKWSFGKLSALREAALALEQGYEYYYMGYYIHGCKKMQYKGDYKPQYVLDYHSLEWNLLDEKMRRLMDQKGFASMSMERARKAANATTSMSEAKAAAADKPQDEPELQIEAANGAAETESTKHPVPLDAFKSGLSLLELGMPGVLSLSQLDDQIDLDTMKIYLGGRGGGNVHETQDIVSWQSGNENDGTSIKGTVAEFAAAVGPDVAKTIVLDFSRG